MLSFNLYRVVTRKGVVSHIAAHSADHAWTRFQYATGIRPSYALRVASNVDLNTIKKCRRHIGPCRKQT